MVLRYPASHVLCAIHLNCKKHTHRKKRDEMKTMLILKISAAPAGVLCALAFFSTATPAAADPVDYCRTDTSGMRGCGFSSLEQCQAMASGRGSNCYENPFPEGGKASSSASGNASSSGKASSSASGNASSSGKASSSASGNASSS